LVVQVGEDVAGFKFLVRDRDTKFPAAFDAVFAAEGIQLLRTPARAPQANAYAERWVGTVRRDVLDRMLIFGRRQLVSVLAEYADHYNAHRPHRALGQAPPLGRPTCHPAGRKGCATSSTRRAASRGCAGRLRYRIPDTHRAWLDSQRDWLRAERLPAHAPELNPVEYLWANLKGTELANLPSATLGEVADAAQHGIQRVCASDELVAGFLANTGLTLGP